MEIKLPSYAFSKSDLAWVFFFCLFKMGPQLSFYYVVGQLNFVGDHTNRCSHTRDMSFRVREQRQSTSLRL